MAAGDGPLTRAASGGSPRNEPAVAVPPGGTAAVATVGTPNGVRARLVRTGASLASRLSDVRGRYAVVDATIRVLQTDRRFFAYAASKLARTIIVATALMWQLPPPKIRWVGPTVICVGTMVANTVLIALTSWLRHTHLLVGLIATIGQAEAWLVTWWWIQTLLPRPAAVRWPQLWRGALLIGIGSGLLHLATVLLLSSKLASESLLYGAFGTAAVILIGGYYIGRLVVGSASLNAFYELPKVADVESAPA